MAAKNDSTAVLLVWSEMIPAMKGQDPLGLNLRVSARLAAQLLHCITSITPRARYFAFFPRCVADFDRREKLNGRMLISAKRSGCVESAYDVLRFASRWRSLPGGSSQVRARDLGAEQKKRICKPPAASRAKRANHFLPTSLWIPYLFTVLATR